MRSTTSRFNIQTARALHAESDRVDGLPEGPVKANAWEILRARVNRLQRDIRDGRLDGADVDRVCREAEGGLTW